MKAVLLAAGNSTRMYPLTEKVPKCLLDFDGKTILEYQLDAFADCGISELVVVTGYLRGVLEEKIKEIKNRYPFTFSFTYNPRFAETNNIYSLWTARKQVRDEAFLCLHADVLFDKGILRSLIAAEGDVVLVADREIAHETMKLRLDGAIVTSVGKHISMKEASGTFVGMARFSSDSGKLLFDEIEMLIEEGEVNGYFTLAVTRMIEKGHEIKASFTGGLPWAEVDIPEELVQAKSAVLPLIQEKLSQNALK